MPSPDFFKQLELGNSGRAFRHFFDTTPLKFRLDWSDAFRCFKTIILQKTYHSPTVCATIRTRFVRSGISEKLKETARGLPIPVPEHPGVAFPCVDEAGNGIILYCAPDTDRHIILSNPHRYSIIPNVLSEIFKAIREMIQHRYFCTVHCNDIIVYRLKSSVSALNPVELFRLNGDRSGALAVTLALAADCDGRGLPDGQTSCHPIIATACLDNGRFYLPGRLKQKMMLIKDELPDAFMTAVGSSSELTGTKLPDGITIIESPECIFPAVEKRSPDFFHRYRDSIEGISRQFSDEKRWHELAVHANHHPPEEIPIPEGISDRTDLLEIHLRYFDTARHTYRFDEAIKLVGRIKALFEMFPNDYHDRKTIFHVNLAVIYSALYRFGDARDCRPSISFGNLVGGQHRLYISLLAECSLLAGETDLARSFLSEAMINMGYEHRTRIRLYLHRLNLVECCRLAGGDSLRLSDDLNGQLTILIDTMIKEKPIDTDRSLPYWYYVLTRAMFLGRRYAEAIEAAEDAEGLFRLKSIVWTWPGILWRRYSARSAEAIGDCATAQQLLNTPLPDTVTDRSILKMHAGVSRLLGWVMNSSSNQGDSSPSPVELVEPLLHPMVAHHFEQDVAILLQDWQNGAHPVALRSRVETIVRRSYE